MHTERRGVDVEQQSIGFWGAADYRRSAYVLATGEKLAPKTQARRKQTVKHSPKPLNQERHGLQRRRMLPQLVS
jgi:hypothetical protein